MNDLGRGNWILMVVLLVVGMAVFVMASTPVWVGSGVNYTTIEGAVYYHNLSANISGFDNDVNFSIDTAVDNKISWTNSTGAPVLVFPSEVSNWISITDVATGNLTINATYNNQTGYFVIPIQAINTTDSLFSGAPFGFIINATNDAPNFTSSGIANNYTFSSGESTNFTLTAADEENHFPLNYTIVFNDTCTHGAATGYGDDSNCNLTAFGLTLTHLSNTTANFSFTPNSSSVGTYWANISVRDSAVDYACPHDWCDATYNTTNLTTYYSQMVLFTVSPSLTIDASNCTGAVLMEEEVFNCTVIVTTPGPTDNLTITSNASFREGSSSGYNRSWFAPSNSSPTASNFNYNITFPVTPTKKNVGNLSIVITVDDDTADTSESTTIYIYVNYTEFNVTLDAISNLNGSSALYENSTFQVNATDEDLLILDENVKAEVLTFASNTSWVAYDSKVTLSNTNYSTANFTVDWDSVMASEGIGNYSILINVTDEAENSASRTFVIEIRNETAPEWDEMDDPVSLNLTENTSFTYNVSMNVSDVDAEDTLTFYYENVSAEFCSLNSSTFNSTTGIINFTPQDCDVGYHNVTIIASDSHLNVSKQFNFTVSNVADDPTFHSLTIDGNTITNGSSMNASEGTESVFVLIIEDHDFLIPSGQKTSFYNETLSVNVTATNSTGDEVSLFNFTFIGMALDYWAEYNASFTPTNDNADNYTIFINISDASGNLIDWTFYLNITSVNDAPNITAFGNLTKTIYDVAYLNVSNYTSDEEGETVTYALYNLTVGGDFLTIDSATGIINLTLNSTYEGVWMYNLTANDTSSPPGVGSRIFYLVVYGNITLLSPATGIVYNVTENVASVLNFTTNHSVGDNLTYEFWIDSITCSYQNSSDCTYENLSLREIESFLGNGTANNWTFTSNFTDETYGNLKNLTIQVYPNTTNLNVTQRLAIAANFSFGLNVSHTNAPVTLTSGFPNPWPDGTIGTAADISLDSYFTDEDFSDSYYLQSINVSVVSDLGGSSLIYAEENTANYLPWNGTLSDWDLQINSGQSTSEELTITVTETDSSVSDSFQIDFTAPSTTPVATPSSRGGSSTKLKHFSLKLIMPQDVIISDQNYIDIPFSVQNNGQIDLKGINLSSYVRFNDEFSDDARISLEDSYIDELKFGQSENFSMRIFANTQKSGRYKATIFADVLSPKFSDFGEFYIDLRKTNETEAEQLLIFTDKFIAENPECLELTELINEAEEAFALGEYSNSLQLAIRATEACEDAIQANEQIKYPVAGFVQENFYYISFSTLAIFLAGFIFYVYKRVRFNKYKVDNYI